MTKKSRAGDREQRWTVEATATAETRRRELECRGSARDVFLLAADFAQSQGVPAAAINAVADRVGRTTGGLTAVDWIVAFVAEGRGERHRKGRGGKTKDDATALLRLLGERLWASFGETRTAVAEMCPDRAWASTALLVTSLASLLERADRDDRRIDALVRAISVALAQFESVSREVPAHPISKVELAPARRVRTRAA